MRKFLSVLYGTKLSERLMMLFGVIILWSIWSVTPPVSEMGYISVAAIFHAASLVYWVCRASALRQGK